MPTENPEPPPLPTRASASRPAPAGERFWLKSQRTILPMAARLALDYLIESRVKPLALGMGREAARLALDTLA